MKKARSRHPEHFQKRGGSSGGGGSSGNADSSTKAQIFSLTTKDEVQSRINDWSLEITEMEEALKGATNKYSGVDPKTLSDSVYIADSVRISARDGYSDFVGIKDANGNIQAAAQISKALKHTEIDYLATAPWNFTKDSRAVKGAGTKAIIEVIKQDLKRGGEGDIRLYAMDKAVPFYEKLGFKPINKDKNRYRLSPEDANKLLEKFGEI
jgi:hypothetical protein